MSAGLKKTGKTPFVAIFVERIKVEYKNLFLGFSPSKSTNFEKLLV